MSESSSPVFNEPKWKSTLKKIWRITSVHLSKHTGVGLLCAVAYFDPGNWGVDLQAGSQYGYGLLFVVLLAGLFAVLLQSMATRLGCVTGLDLASHCRLLFYDRPKHKLLYRWGVLYPLYAIAEIAIISTDLAELLGSGMALVMLIPRLPLWGGLLITAADVFIILLVGDPVKSRPVKMFEWLIAVMVFGVLICMVVIVSKVSVDWGDAFYGFLPSNSIFQAGGLYTSVGIIGATVMPHSLFLGSHLGTQDRVSTAPKDDTYVELSSENPPSRIQLVKSRITSTFVVGPAYEAPRPQRYQDRENNTFAFIKAHLYHALVDLVISLLGFAVLINSLILILASAVFYYGKGANPGSRDPADLFDAQSLLRDTIGEAAAILFAVALLFSGQSSSLIATVAGQIVSEGFINWTISPFLRRILTRLLGLIPSMTVAAVVGKAGIAQLLVASQVVLSVVLPFMVLPLVWLTSNKSIMSVKKPVSTTVRVPANVRDSEQGEEVEMVDFSIGWVTTITGYLVWLAIVIANAYVLILLCMGNGS